MAEQVDTETELEELLELFYRCPVGLIAFDDGGAVDKVNPEAVRLIAAAIGSTDFANIFDILAPVWPDLTDLVAGATAHGRLVDDHHLIGDAPTDWALGCTLVRLAPRRNILLVSDATARVAAEIALRESEQFTRRVLDNLFAYAGVLTPDGTLLAANRAPLEAAGLDAKDVVGRKFWDCYWWSYSTDVQDQLRRAIERSAAGETVRYDVPVRVADDQRIWVDFQLAPLRNSCGAITHLVPSGLDLSERIRAEHERAALLEAERDARRQIEMLERNATQVASATTVEEVAATVLNELQATLSLDLAAINVVIGNTIRVFAGSGVPDAMADRLQVVPIDAELPGALSIRTNKRVHLTGGQTISDRFPMLHFDPEVNSSEALIALPLRAADNSALGALVVSSLDPEWPSARELSILNGVAGQIGQAFERARLYEQVIETQKQEHAVALKLQEALLPDSVISHPKVSIASRFSAASDLLTVGGDWYDTFSWPDGHIGAMVGDVVGHDLEAAATMGRLRAAAAALAAGVGPHPAAILDAVHAFSRSANGTAFATAACVVLEPNTGLITYASAGHPPILLVSNDGTITWLDEALSPPLGPLDIASRPEARARLDPGATLILYTDGLVERRASGVDERLSRLAELAAELRHLDVDDLVAGIVDGMTTDAKLEDDMIGLCLRLDG